MQALFCKPVLLAAPALRAGQAKHSALPISHSEQQQPLLLLYTHRHHPPLAQMERAFAVEASLQDPSPTPSTPTPTPTIQTPNLTDFTLVSLGLVSLFWFVNYVVPDYIFKFGPDAGNKNDADKRRKVLDGLVGGIDKTSSQGASGSEALASSEEGTVRGTGFGKRVSKARKENK